jgi:hypothetical protein
VIRRHSLLKERGKPTSGESTTILLLVPHPRNFIEEDRDWLTTSRLSPATGSVKRSATLKAA